MQNRVYNFNAKKMQQIAKIYNRGGFYETFFTIAMFKDKIVLRSCKSLCHYSFSAHSALDQRKQIRRGSVEKCLRWSSKLYSCLRIV